MTASRQWQAWSCTVRLVIDDDRHIAAAADQLTELLARVDRAASRFRPDSALSQANAKSGIPVPIPRLLVDLVHSALVAAEQTAGAVDPTVGASVVASGYDRDISEIVSTDVDVALDVPAAGWQKVRLDVANGLLTVPRGGLLDLGATAKAFTADLAARTLASRFDTSVLVEIGGDLAVAGTDQRGWPIMVAEREGGPGEVIQLHHGGLATSTTTVRTWRRGSRRMHHIMDPSTGRPAREIWRTVTVAAASALAANTASTAAIVMGDPALEWLTERGLAARLVRWDARVFHTPTWPDEIARVAS